jgi:hypothetical protein
MWGAAELGLWGGSKRWGGGGTVRTLLPTFTALVVCLPCNLWNAMKVLSWVLTEPIPAAADYRRPAHDHVLAGVFLLSALVTQ